VSQFTCADWLAGATDALNRAGLGRARFEAEHLAAAMLKLSRPQLLLYKDRLLSQSEARMLRDALERRAKRWPLAYIVGEQPFASQTIRVTPSVLIPRPETELLVERGMKRLMPLDRPLEVADVGTGSGCIALALAREDRIKHVWAIDRSRAALAIAKANARRLGLSKKIRFIHGNLLAPLINGHRVDAIFANLPYIPRSDLKKLQAEVRREPKSALDGGPDGLLLIRRLVQQAPSRLRGGSWLMMEVGIGQSAEVARWLKSSASWSRVEVENDFAGIGRMVMAERKGD
jgi:release factor glutamine methyltransferase